MPAPHTLAIKLGLSCRKLSAFVVVLNILTLAACILLFPSSVPPRCATEVSKSPKKARYRRDRGGAVCTGQCHAVLHAAPTAHGHVQG